MTTKVKPEPVAVDDLRSLRDALDAPARAKQQAEARERELEQRADQDRLLAYARGIVRDLQDATAASAAWDATPVDVPALRQNFGEDTPVFRAHNAVNSGSGPIADAAREASAVDRLIAELERPGILPAARLDMILKALDAAAGHAQGFLGVYGGWVRMRQDGVGLLPAMRAVLDALERRWKPTAAELALLAREQQRLADAAAAMPRPAPRPPHRGIPGADVDAEQPAVSRRAQLLENRYED